MECVLFLIFHIVSACLSVFVSVSVCLCVFACLFTIFRSYLLVCTLILYFKPVLGDVEAETKQEEKHQKMKTGDNNSKIKRVNLCECDNLCLGFSSIFTCLFTWACDGCESCRFFK